MPYSYYYLLIMPIIYFVFVTISPLLSYLSLKNICRNAENANTKKPYNPGVFYIMQLPLSDCLGGMCSTLTPLEKSPPPFHIKDHSKLPI